MAVIAERLSIEGYDDPAEISDDGDCVYLTLPDGGNVALSLDESRTLRQSLKRAENRIFRVG